MMSPPLDCKQHLGGNGSCFVYLDEGLEKEKLRRLCASPYGEFAISVDPPEAGHLVWTLGPPRKTDRSGSNIFEHVL